MVGIMIEKRSWKLILRDWLIMVCIQVERIFQNREQLINKRGFRDKLRVNKLMHD